MRRSIALVAPLLLILSSRSHGQQPAVTPPDRGGQTTMVVSPATARPAAAGASETFTGSVQVTPLFQPAAPARTGGALVTFQPGARSAWHTHPLGQTLIVTAGTGWVQQEGGDKREIRVGDVIWTPPGIKHWHGASATSAMTHLAIQEAQDGTLVTWLEQVSDAQYLGRKADERP
jgi:quercetin dioxygenase-like cupin family protein